MAVEQALELPVPDWLSDPRNRRRLAACGAIVVGLLSVVGSCTKDSNGGSPIDTNGTKGSGYHPGGGWPGEHRQPQGLELRRQPYVDEAVPADAGAAALGAAISDILVELPPLMRDAQQRLLQE